MDDAIRYTFKVEIKTDMFGLPYAELTGQDGEHLGAISPFILTDEEEVLIKLKKV